MTNNYSFIFRVSCLDKCPAETRISVEYEKRTCAKKNKREIDKK